MYRPPRRYVVQLILNPHLDLHGILRRVEHYLPGPRVRSSAACSALP